MQKDISLRVAHCNYVCNIVGLEFNLLNNSYTVFKFYGQQKIPGCCFCSLPMASFSIWPSQTIQYINSLSEGNTRSTFIYLNWTERKNNVYNIWWIKPVYQVSYPFYQPVADRDVPWALQLLSLSFWHHGYTERHGWQWYSGASEPATYDPTQFLSFLYSHIHVNIRICDYNLKRNCTSSFSVFKQFCKVLILSCSCRSVSCRPDFSLMDSSNWSW